jgi:hypothetical protein
MRDQAEPLGQERSQHRARVCKADVRIGASLNLIASGAEHAAAIDDLNIEETVRRRAKTKDACPQSQFSFGWRTSSTTRTSTGARPASSRRPN